MLITMTSQIDERSSIVGFVAEDGFSVSGAKSPHRQMPARAPFAESLISVGDRFAGSLHALPLAGGHSIEGSALEETYKRLFGDEYFQSDLSISGDPIDSFFRPKSCLASAQKLAAKAFGSDATLFVTCGTTTANRISVEALRSLAGKRPEQWWVLADRTSHQSIHFQLEQMSGRVSYAAQRTDEGHNRSWLNVDDLIRQFKEAARSGEPFDTVVLCGASYDGAIINYVSLFGELIKFTDSLHLLIDEAWSAVNNFHPELREASALEAARRVRQEHPAKDIQVVVTHSAHKSMSAIRQGSYVHVLGSQQLVAEVKRHIYRIHTTSPSLPILASLDLARAQAEMEGEELLERSLVQMWQLRNLIESDPDLSSYSLALPPGAEDQWMREDPTKVLLCVDGLGLNGQEFREKLLSQYSIYVARSTRDGVVLHMHIGVTASIFSRLMDAMRDIQLAAMFTRESTVCPKGTFLIAYPPGTPLLLPGQTSTGMSSPEVVSSLPSGAEVFFV